MNMSRLQLLNLEFQHWIKWRIQRFLIAVLLASMPFSLKTGCKHMRQVYVRNEIWYEYENIKIKILEYEKNC